MSYDFPTGQECISLGKIIIDHLQPELEKLDPGNPLLKLKINDSGDGIEYPPAFGERFEGVPINKAICAYQSLLKVEIGRLKNNSRV